MKKLYKNSLKTSVKSGKYKLLRERRYHMFCICLPTEHGNPEVSEGRKKEEKGGLGKEESRSRRGRDVTDHAHSRQEEDEDDDVACLLAAAFYLNKRKVEKEKRKWRVICFAVLLVVVNLRSSLTHFVGFIQSCVHFLARRIMPGVHDVACHKVFVADVYIFLRKN
jgi:hypothetical protein